MNNCNVVTVCDGEGPISRSQWGCHAFKAYFCTSYLQTATNEFVAKWRLLTGLQEPTRSPSQCEHSGLYAGIARLTKGVRTEGNLQQTSEHTRMRTAGSY